MSKSAILSILTLSICAIGFGAAPAFAAHEYKALSSPWEFAGGNPSSHVFEFGSQDAECAVASFKGKQPTPAIKVREVPHYATCTGFTTVNVEFCAYELLEPQGGPFYAAAMNIVKEGTGVCAIKFIRTGCTVVVGEQPFETPVLGEENVVLGAMKVFFKVSGIKYTHSGTCTGIGNGHDGTYDGTENIEELNIV
jgi:hypothetical protein